MNTFTIGIVTHILAFLKGISAEQLTAALKLVQEAEQLYKTRSDKFKFVAEELGKLYDTLVIHPDGVPNNTLTLIIALAVNISDLFNLWTPHPAKAEQPPV